MKKADPLPPVPGIALNELDKMFFWGEPLGSRPIARILFELKGGPVAIELLRQAYLLELQRRPVLNATIVEFSGGRGWNVRWVPRPAADAAACVRLYDLSGLSAEEAAARFNEIQFDPFTDYSASKDPPLSMALCCLPGGRQKLVGFVYHGLTDAYGFGLIFEELFTLYNLLADGRATDDACQPVPCRQPESLLPASRLRWLAKLAGAFAVIAGHAMKTGFQPSAKIYSGENTLASITAAVQRELPQERLAAYLAAAKRQGVTLNELLVAAQIRAIERYKTSRGEAAGLISVDVHHGLRKADSELQDLSNKFSTFIVATLPRHRRSPKELVQHVHREHQVAQQRGTAEKLVCLLGLLDTRIAAKARPLLNRLFFSNPAIGESSQVTNMGRLWPGPGGSARLTRLGSAEITGCFMTALPSPAVGNFSGFLTFNNKLFAMFNYFTRTMTDQEARQFMELFEASLEELAACA